MSEDERKNKQLTLRKFCAETDRPQITSLFEAVVFPLYGNQEQYLEKIFVTQDRECMVLVNQNSKIIGLVVYKKVITNEYGLNGIEIKTLVVYPSTERRQGYGSMLLNSVIEYGKIIGASWIWTSVSESASEAQSFFTNKGFKAVHTKVNSHLNEDEYVMACNFTESTNV